MATGAADLKLDNSGLACGCGGVGRGEHGEGVSSWVLLFVDEGRLGESAVRQRGAVQVMVESN